jgi:formylglycine-generating enzyme required for sulfatase activity
MRKLFVIFAVVLLGCVLCACGKKEESAEGKSDKTDKSESTSPSTTSGDMVLVPAGDFIMGTDDKESLSFPKHTVNLPAFWIDKFEVTNNQFLDFSIKEKYAGEGAKEGRDWRLWFTRADQAQLPVVYITWNDATAYCKSLGKRLPTEEEWEKAARGTDGRGYPWGSDWADNRSNTAEAGYRKAVAVGQFDDVSPYGAHDMLGNVQEWTASLFSIYKGNPKKDPNQGKDFRVVRGLSSNHRGRYAHLWDRIASPPSSLYGFGFRCAKDATP